MEFESNVGDLASLLKVEKKRATAMRADSKLVMYMYVLWTHNVCLRFYTVTAVVFYYAR